MNFNDKLKQCAKTNNSLLCVGLDPSADKIPDGLSFVEFLTQIIDATHDLVCAYKPNSAFFEAKGAVGIEELKAVCDYIRERYPNIPIILDAKRADIDSTNLGYAEFAFDYLMADALTVHPYLGGAALGPLLDRKDRGIIVLCHTSNQGADEFQELMIDGKKLYQLVAKRVAKRWNKNQNCLLVVGATYPEAAAEIREIAGDDTIFLIPGIGAQGGNTQKIVKAAMNRQGEGIIINASRSILYTEGGSDFAANARKAAIQLRNEINQAKETV